MKKIVSVVVPMYFEEEVAKTCYERLKKVCDKLKNYNYELIFVNDGSKDKTLEILESIAKDDKKVKVISFSRNFGQQSAVTAGLRHVNGDAIVIIDADLQDPPELIPDMLKLWEEGNDVIYGKRKKREGETFFKKFTSKMFYRTINKLSDIDMPLDTGDFRLVDRRVVESINNLPEHNRYLRGLFTWVGYKQVPIEFERKERLSGETKWTTKKMFRLASDGIISFSSKPLKMVGVIGIISLIVSFAILVYAILSYIFKFDAITSGWTSTIIIIAFFSGLQLISIWLMSEYVARIYDEVKKRPQYIIDKKINFDDEEQE